MAEYFNINSITFIQIYNATQLMLLCFALDKSQIFISYYTNTFFFKIQN